MLLLLFRFPRSKSRLGKQRPPRGQSAKWLGRIGVPKKRKATRRAGRHRPRSAAAEPQHRTGGQGPGLNFGGWGLGEEKAKSERFLLWEIKAKMLKKENSILLTS
jgi:hypothetical protein